MQIDWLTVAAQWINFLILMWLLRRYLYQPILQAMDKRQQAIAARAAAAVSKTEQAEQLARDYRDKLAELEAHRDALMAA
ncbi:F0F1 ATP synthase subunit B family protein, partial [Methylomonas rivi]|nr:F0F1 ATP synthase subunit B [Methylomonas sp. WSC-6]